MFFIIMGSIGQWAALVATSAGIAIEFIYEADERRRHDYETGLRNKGKFPPKR